MKSLHRDIDNKSYMIITVALEIFTLLPLQLGKFVGEKISLNFMLSQ